jgi:hypothetical protein
MPCPSHPPWLDHSNYTCRRIQVMKLALTSTNITFQMQSLFVGFVYFLEQISSINILTELWRSVSFLGGTNKLSNRYINRSESVFNSWQSSDWLWDLPSLLICTGRSFPEGKVAEEWNWTLTSKNYRDQDCEELYLRFLICLQGVVLNQIQEHTLRGPC